MKKIAFRQSIHSIVIFVILMAFIGNPISETVIAQTSYNKADLIPYDLKAPWPAGVTFHLGGYKPGVNEGSFYGDNYHTNNGDQRDYYAIDVNGNATTEEPVNDSGVLVFSVADGKVTLAKPQNGYGNTVVIGHPGGYSSRYAHLTDTPLVKEGDWIPQGTPIGYIGMTGGTSTGDHLHFAMYYCDPKLSEADCDKPENKYSSIPEPMEGKSSIASGDRLTSTNYGVGYEELKITNTDKKTAKDFSDVFHSSFQYTYQVLGGQTTVFGPSKSPVKKYSSNIQSTNYWYQEFNRYTFDKQSIWYDLESVLFEVGNTAFLIAGPIWEKYHSLNGASSYLGLPVSQTYLWDETAGSTNYQGLRNDFEHGSIIWLKNKGIKVLDSTNAPWEVTFYRLPNFTDQAFTRRDEHINFSWTPVPMSSMNSSLSVGAFSSMVAKAVVDVGLIAIYRIRASIQGHVEIFSDNYSVLNISSPNSYVTDDSTSIKVRQTDVEVRFWQNPLTQASIKVTAEGLGIIPKVYAAEEYSASMEAIPENPKITYASYDPPPYFDNSTIPTVPPASSSSSSSILVLDTSGSMNEMDSSQRSKLQAAQAAATNILDIIAAEVQGGSGQGSQVGLVDFNRSSRIDAALTTDIASVQNALQSLNANGGTGMAEGLQTGLSLFPNQSTTVKQMIILLSDGNPNVPLPGSLAFDKAGIQQEVLDLATQAGDRGICVYTIGFGIPSAQSGLSLGELSIDEEFLRQVAAASKCGTYYSAKDANQLANVFVELRHSSMGSVVFQQSGQIAQGQQIDLGDVEVPSNQELMLFTLNWPGSKLEPVLKDPTGTVVDQNYTGATISASSTLVSIVMSNPKPGNWNLSVVGVDIPEGITQYNTIISTRAGTAVLPPQSGGSFPIVVLILVLAGGGIGVYVYSQSIQRTSKRGGVTLSSAQLVGTRGAFAGQPVALRDGMIIGRGSASGLRINDPSISRWHARLRFAQGAWYIQDMGSKSGILINGQRVAAARLNSGDQIQIGANTFTFQAGGK